MHLRWEPSPPPSRSITAVLEVVVPPRVDELYFWALQVSFLDGGRHVGAAHLGLQWHPGHPGNTAVNWGGYAAAGGELDGETSPLPSATANPNTRDFVWVPRRRYRLAIDGDGDGSWRGTVTDLSSGRSTVVRRLHGGGTTIGDPVVWSEVFAPCDAPSVTVRWSGFDPLPVTMQTTYQSVADGGCSNVISSPDGDGWRQTTNTRRPA